MKRLLWLLLVLALLALALFAGYWFGTPGLVSSQPADDEQDLPAATPLRLTFSRNMQPDTVLQRLQIRPNQPGEYTWEGDTLIFTPDQPWPSGERVRVELAAGARAAGWLSLPTRQAYRWSFTIGTPRLAYLFPADGPANILVIDPRSGESQPLTELPGGVSDFDVNHSGSAIFYSTPNSEGGSDIYRLDLLESELESGELILSCGRATCRVPVVSPGDEFLAYEQTAPTGSELPPYPQVWYVPLAGSQDGSAGSALTQPASPRLAGEPLHQTLQPQWSPDGRLTFYDTQLNAFVFLDPRGAEATTFPNQTGEPGNWEPGGEAYVAPEIFFVEVGESSELVDLNLLGSSHLLRFSLADGTIQDLSQMDDLEDTTPVFSPDGTSLAFARKYLDVTRWTPGRQLWLMNPDGSGARQLTNEPFFNHYAFAWSPTGAQIAYVRFNQTTITDPPEIWLISVPDAQAYRLVQGGYNPQWIP